MTKQAKSVADAIASASPNSGGGRFFEGDTSYPLVALDSCGMHSGFKGESFKARFLVLASSDPDIRKGASRMVINNHSTQKDIALGATLAMLMAFSGRDRHEVDSEFVGKVLASDDPVGEGLLRRYASLETTTRVSQKGVEYTVHDWRPIDDDDVQNTPLEDLL